MNEKYIVAWSQDHHLFHRRLKTDNILDFLEHLVPESGPIAETMAMYVIGGDFWDHLYSNVYDDDYEKVVQYIAWRLKTARKQGYSVRVLKGTPSHDRDQSKLWKTINDVLEEPADLRYVDTLSIEHHPILGHILYIPDNWKPSADEVWEDVCDELRKHNIEKVDWIFCHFAFKHQLPEIVREKSNNLHDPERYSAICRKYIFVGHIHIRSHFLNIISASSVDKMTFGDDGLKGGLRAHCYSKHIDIEFVNNKHTRVMSTINVEKMTLDEIVNKLQSKIEKDGTYSSYRLVCSKTHEVNFNVKNLNTHFNPVEIVTEDINSKPKNHLTQMKERKKLSTAIDLSNHSAKIQLIKRIGVEMNDGIQDKLDKLFDE